MKERFRKFWMASVADAFKDDLEEIRKVRIMLISIYMSPDPLQEPNLTTSRLALLIDSLAAGADAYSSSRGPNGNATNEMEVILGD